MRHREQHGDEHQDPLADERQQAIQLPAKHVDSLANDEMELGIRKSGVGGGVVHDGFEKEIRLPRSVAAGYRRDPMSHDCAVMNPRMDTLPE